VNKINFYISLHIQTILIAIPDIEIGVGKPTYFAMQDNGPDIPLNKSWYIDIAWLYFSFYIGLTMPRKEKQ
jgi:hypothetical protein